MQETSQKRMRIDLNRFKLHIGLDDAAELTLHFNSASRRFYLSVIALLIVEMKKQGKIFSVPLAKHLDLLALLNETVGGSVGASTRESLLPRIYRKWKSALPDIENAPLFKIVGRNKYYDDGAAKTYRLGEAEKDGWANLFEYKGSEENVRLRFSIDALGAGLDDVVLTYGESSDTAAWEKFIDDLKKEQVAEAIPQAAAERPANEIGEKKSARRILRRFAPAAMIVVVVGAVGLISWNYYLSRSRRVEPASLEKMAFPLPDKPSIAVLPFANLTGDPQQEYLSDGMTEEIITALSKVPYLFVIAHNSTFAYKGKPVKIHRIAEELGVRYVMEGSFRKAEDKVRVAAQLIDAISGRHLWAEHYDRDLKDIFALQDEITMEIIKALEVRLTEGEQAHMHRIGTKNPQAYVKCLQAIDHFNQRNKEDNLIARKLAEETIVLDALYSRPYRVVGYSHLFDVWSGTSDSPKKSFQKALEFAQKAISLDDSHPCNYELLSAAYMTMGQPKEAIAAAEHCITLDPNGADGRAILGCALRIAGRFEEAIVLLNKAIRLNPIAPSWYFESLGKSYASARHYQEAIAAFQKALNRAPSNFLVHRELTITYFLSGHIAEGRSQAKELLRLQPRFSFEGYARSLQLRNPADKMQLIDALQKAGLD
jgi:TolB-like protein